MLILKEIRFLRLQRFQTTESAQASDVVSFCLSFCSCENGASRSSSQLPCSGRIRLEMKDARTLRLALVNSPSA